ncbi:MAG: hypothetical protein LBU51_11205 [Bacteroidales bacterium]|nr:hypothetical protein [Bacteroidales bacterium]
MTKKILHKSIKNLTIIAPLLVSSCCVPVFLLENSNKNEEDIRINKNEWSISFTSGLSQNTGSDRFKYSKDSLRSRLRYRFEIPKQVSTVKLNSFSFMQKDITMSYALYYEGIDADNGKARTIDAGKLPVYLDKKKKDMFKGAVFIIIECSEAYAKINNVCISYDIELDDEHIIKKDIKYKRRLYLDCRPKF